jgi:hypothetical protein
MADPSGLDRREFPRRGVAADVGLSLGPLAAPERP